MTALTVICVKRRPLYTAEDVHRLHRGVRRYIPECGRFICLTDDASDMAGIETRPLIQEWPGWWAKMAIYPTPPPVLYLDLDTVLVRPLEGIVETVGDRFAMLRDFTHPERRNTGVLAWGDSPVPGKILEVFMTDPATIMARWQVGGDGWFVDGLLGPCEAGILQDMFPHRIVSYKSRIHRIMETGDLPPEASVVCFHGRPKPHEVAGQHPWIPTSRL